MIVFLWTADGPDEQALGISGDQQAAREWAEGCLLSGQATTARVDEAAGEIGIATLMDGWRPTGRAWTARSQPGGGVSWARLAAPELRAAS